MLHLAIATHTIAKQRVQRGSECQIPRHSHTHTHTHTHKHTHTHTHTHTHPSLGGGGATTSVPVPGSCSQRADTDGQNTRRRALAGRRVALRHSTHAPSRPLIPWSPLTRAQRAQRMAPDQRVPCSNPGQGKQHADPVLGAGAAPVAAQAGGGRVPVRRCLEVAPGFDLYLCSGQPPPPPQRGGDPPPPHTCKK